MADPTQEGIEEGDQEAPAPSARKLPLALLMVGVQTLVLLGAGGLIFYVSLSPPKAALEVASLQERAIASVRVQESQVQIVTFDPFVANLQDNSTLQAKIEVEVTNEQTAQTLRDRIMPIAQARILTLLTQQKAGDLEKVQGKLHLNHLIHEALDEELLKAGMKEGVVRSVFFTDLITVWKK